MSLYFLMLTQMRGNTSSIFLSPTSTKLPLICTRPFFKSPTRATGSVSSQLSVSGLWICHSNRQIHGIHFTGHWPKGMWNNVLWVLTYDQVQVCYEERGQTTALKWVKPSTTPTVDAQIKLFYLCWLPSCGNEQTGALISNQAWCSSSALFPPEPLARFHNLSDICGFTMIISPSLAACVRRYHCY